MNNRFTLKQLAETLGFSPPSVDAEFSQVAYDSRQVKPGDLFIATKGQRVDGHDFIPEVETRGAGALLLSRPVPTKLPYLVVPNVVEAIGAFAHHWRNQFSLPMIAVTGSNGKTTTKSMITAILKAVCQNQEEAILVTSKSHNTDITVPVYLLQLNPLHRWAVLEIGMSHFEEIAYLSRMVQPTVAVITNALPSHLVGVGGTVKGVAQAKGEIFQGLGKQGTAVLNRDDHYYEYWKRLAEDRNVISFGFHSDAKVSVKNIETSQEASRFKLQVGLDSIFVQLPLAGKHNIRNALAAAAACLAVGIDLETIKRGLEAVVIAYQRLKVHHLSRDVVVIDDSYNANPASTQAAIDVLIQRRGQKILVLGDMKELGENEEAYHREMGEYAKNQGVDRLFGLGTLTQKATEAFGENAMHFQSKSALKEALKNWVKSDVCVLVKGSRSMAMEEVVESLIK